MKRKSPLEREWERLCRKEAALDRAAVRAVPPAWKAGLEARDHTMTCYGDKTTDPAELLRRTGDSDIAIIANNPYPDEVVRATPSLKMLAVAFTGFDHVGLEACRQQKVTLCNAAGYSKVSEWKKITSIDKLQRGDLIFFYNNAYTKVGHVGIYIGGGTMIDASSSNGKVVKRSCTTSYWRKHFVCGRRPF